MPTVSEHARAIARAKAAGDTEAVEYIRSQMVAQQQAEDAETNNPTSGMSGMDKVRANLGAGFANFGQGLAQLVLPKPLEQAVGITDESISDKRARDEVLADNTTGGGALQVAGEALPSLAIPGGVGAKALTSVPKLGLGLKAAGVGTRALPTLVADSAAMGALSGAITPTMSDESALGRAAMGAATGAFLPMGLAAGAKAGGALLRPFVPALQQKALAGTIGETLDVSPAAQKALEKSIKASNQRVVDAPQSLASITQDPAVARLELAARANPDTATSWTGFDQDGLNARWKALADTLGSDTTVQAAKAETNNFASLAIPELFKGVNGKALADGVADFGTAVQGRLTSAVKNADPARQEVYGYVKQALDQGGGSPQMLWNIRKTISEWLEGTPPPGKEGTRGMKMDAPIMETRKAIDEVLNRATGGKKWSKFLEKYGEFARKESQQKAGQNIRNAFFDETLAIPRGATTSAGNPAVTRARLEQALVRFGKNDFGDALDYGQRDVVDQVLTDLRADEILQRAKSSMTGKGGSQTAPLEALMKSSASKLSGGVLTDVAKAFAGQSSRKQQQILNQILQSPEDALVLMRQAERLKRPLTASEQRLIQASRAVLASPSLLVLMNKSADQPSE
jgi:hypothetical protein